jgi:hypothetical protein
MIISNAATATISDVEPGAPLPETQARSIAPSAPRRISLSVALPSKRVADAAPVSAGTDELLRAVVPLQASTQRTAEDRVASTLTPATGLFTTTTRKCHRSWTALRQTAGSRLNAG